MKDYLKQFQFPEDLKEMDYDELELLSYEIRDFLIEKVSKTAGPLNVHMNFLPSSVSVWAKGPSQGPFDPNGRTKPGEPPLKTLYPWERFCSAMLEVARKIR